jgi:hypothetical protein
MSKKNVQLASDDLLQGVEGEESSERGIISAMRASRKKSHVAIQNGDSLCRPGEWQRFSLGKRLALAEAKDLAIKAASEGQVPDTVAGLMADLFTEQGGTYIKPFRMALAQKKELEALDEWESQLLPIGEILRQVESPDQQTDYGKLPAHAQFHERLAADKKRLLAQGHDPYDVYCTDIRRDTADGDAVLKMLATIACVWNAD